MKPKYHLAGESFVIDHYNDASPFSNFLPALAGLTGKPIWVFYANRGQAVASFGINNKDGAMLEFLPANKAYQAIPLLGFRTFLKSPDLKLPFYEPFALHSEGHQSMVVRPYEFELKERHAKAGLEISVVYFGVPHEECPVLARGLTIKNLAPRARSFQLIDGLPRVAPLGMSDYLVKHMSRTIEAFSEVLNISASVPFFKLKIEPQDRPEFKWLKSGFFSFSLLDGGFAAPIVDPSLVFGNDTSFLIPACFTNRNLLSTSSQQTSNIMPSAFSYDTFKLEKEESKTLVSYFGYMESAEKALEFAARVRGEKAYFEAKRGQMKHLYHQLVSHLGFSSEIEPLNQYTNATFMDNVLRGGYPESLAPNGAIVHVYSRKHGDMERDYNAFEVSATYYSQGNGSFRDVNQNRRHDLSLNPRVGTLNVDFFFNLLQLDGYNPLIINPVKFILPKDMVSRVQLEMSHQCQADLQQLMRGPVLAGQLYEFIKKYAADPLNVNNHFRDVISSSVPQHSVQHGEGFWVDHWIYNLDHLDSFLSIFPEKKQWLLFEREDFTFYDSDHFVRPRREKYIVTKEGELRQSNAVVHNEQKAELIASRSIDPHKVRMEFGRGDILQTSLFIKLIALTAVKASTLDPFGVGIEMEANKPGWCDAMNGLPGLFGSSTHEMYELHRLVKFLLHDALPSAPNKAVDIPVEIASLIREIQTALSSISGNDFRTTWNKLATARETFREKTFFGVSGKLRNVKIIDVKSFLEKVSKTLSQAERKTLDPATGLPTSYFVYSVRVSELDDGWRQFLHKLPWKQHRVAPFLEGAVHAMRMVPPSKARQLYQAVRRSDLYDKKLGMYRLNVPLREEPMDLGRIRVFERGWLENESIFLHMHYKFLLEILRSGHVDLFLNEMDTGLIPFRDPQTYGRPIFENSSFVASSSFPDDAVHGKGFVARLSGATAEFMSMMYLMAFGRKPFRLVEGQLYFAPEPILPKEWFRKSETDRVPKNSFSIKLFGVPIIYINPHRKDTFGKRGAKPASFEWILDGRFYQHKGPHLTSDASLALRDGRLESLTVFIS